ELARMTGPGRMSSEVQTTGSVRPEMIVRRHRRTEVVTTSAVTFRMNEDGLIDKTVVVARIWIAVRAVVVKLTPVEARVGSLHGSQGLGQPISHLGDRGPTEKTVAAVGIAGGR